MKTLLEKISSNISLYALSGFMLLALINPVFKKYDYGAGFPLVMIFAVIIFVLCIFEFHKNREPAITEKFLLFVFAVFLLLSFYFSQTKNIGLSELVAYLSVIALYLLYAYQKLKWKLSFLKVLAFGTVLASVLAFFLYIFGDQPRMVGPFFNIFYHANYWPNAFALYLLMTWPVFFIFFKGKWDIPRVLIFSFIIATLLLTFSRGAFIAFFGQLFLLFIYTVKNFKPKFLVTLAILLITTLVFFFLANYFRSLSHPIIDVEDKIEFQNQEGLTSKQERIEFWKGAIQIIKDNPIFGTGPFSFRYAYNPIQPTFLASSDHPHNLFLKIGAENGLIALFAFALFLLLILFKSFRSFKKVHKSEKDMLILLWISVAGAIAHNLIDYNFNFFINLFLLFLFLAFIRSIIATTLIKLPKMAVCASFISLLILLISLYEGGLAVISLYYSDDPNIYTSYREQSLYPRMDFLDFADFYISKDNLDRADYFIDLQLELNPLDAQAHYLNAVILCNEEYIDYNLEKCSTGFKEAIFLNPMNEISYYRDYMRSLIRLGLDLDDVEFKDTFDQSVRILMIYFDYVENNVHFTAYTQNVEASAELIDIILPYLPQDQALIFNENRQRMLDKASQLRSEKPF